jgi:hypothetical protein
MDSIQDTIDLKINNTAPWGMSNNPRKCGQAIFLKKSCLFTFLLKILPVHFFIWHNEVNFLSAKHMKHE